MIKGLFSFLLILFLLSNAYSQCNETQIDINDANITELDKIKWVGTSTAEKIISYRETNTFDSVDELDNVSGIGESKLSDIIAEGLACVDGNAGETEEATETDDNQEEYSNNNSNGSNTQVKTPENIQGKISDPTTQALTLDMIALDSNSKDIKSGGNNENLGKNLALGGVAAFCALFGTLFFLKYSRRKKQNEFR